MKNRIMKIVLGVCALLAIGCASVPANKLAGKLAGEGYFIPKETNKKGKYGPVFIFPEQHDSRFIQAQIAWGLEELRERGGINTIALEGMYIGEVLDAEKLSYRTEDEKHAVLLSLLERGEIKAPELAYLAKDSYVFGIENEKQYQFTIPDGADKAFIYYLIRSMDIDRGEASELVDEEDFDLLLSQNHWARETVEMFGGRSLMAIIERLEELEEKVKPISLLFPAQIKADFKLFKEDYENSHQRSLTMAGSVFDMLQKKNEALAMIIGMNHTKEVTEKKKKKGVRYYVLDPAGLYGGDVWSDLTDAGFEQKRAGMPVFEHEQVTQFFVNKWNTRPVIGKEWFKKENHFVLLIERMIAGRPDFASGGLQVDQDTLDRDNTADIKFKMVNEDGRELYVRAAVNPQFKPSNSYKKAIENMIDSLSMIDEKNLPFTERIKALGDVIEAFNLDGYTVFVSPSPEVWNFNLQTLR
jgi:hypothetical protein